MAGQTFSGLGPHLLQGNLLGATCHRVDRASGESRSSNKGDFPLCTASNTHSHFSSSIQTRRRLECLQRVTKMINSLETKPYEKQLRELGVFSLVKAKGKGKAW